MMSARASSSAIAQRAAGPVGGRAAAAIEAELARVSTRRSPCRRLGLLDAVRTTTFSPRPTRLEEAGLARPRDDRGDPARIGSDRGAADRRLVVLLHRYAVTRRLIVGALRRRDAGGPAGPGLLAAFGRFLLLWNELTSLAVTDGYRTAERDILARVASRLVGARSRSSSASSPPTPRARPPAPRRGAATA